MGVLLPDGVGVFQLLVGCRLEQEVPFAEIALSYKKILYRKVNSLICALVENVTIFDWSVPGRIWSGAVSQAEPSAIGTEQVT
jgi:hypothetical protein